MEPRELRGGVIHLAGWHVRYEESGLLHGIESTGDIIVDVQIVQINNVYCGLSLSDLGMNKTTDCARADKLVTPVVKIC